MTTLLDAISGYLLTPEVFWPDDHYFHRRNRDKIARARAQLGVQTREDVQAHVLPGLLARAKDGGRSLFLISCGASGDEILAPLIASSPRYRLVGEVYFPEALVKLADELADPMEARALMDCVSALPMGSRELLSPARIPVNVMHLRSDSPLDQIRTHLPGARQVALLRNPYDVAVSRSFRKQSYRQAANPGMDDLEYATMQSRYVRNIFALMEQKYWNARLRYEDLLQDPQGQASALLQTLKLPADGLEATAEGAGPQNAGPPGILPTRIQTLFRDILGPTVQAWGYELPPKAEALPIVPLSAGIRNLWLPMRETLLTPEVIGAVQREKALFVGAKLPSFDPLNGIAGVGLETRSAAWKQQFWSLCWLHLLEHLEGGAALQEWWFWQMLDLADEYTRLPDSAPAEFWDGPACARRAATLLWCVYKYSDRPEMEQRIDQLDRLFLAHLEHLEGGLFQSRGTGNAQLMPLALGYISLLVHAEMPELEGRAERLQYGLDWLAEALTCLVDPETGATREQCFHNLLQRVGLVEEVAEALEQTGLEIGFDCRQVIDRMLAFAEELCVGGHCLPAIGDTPLQGGYDRAYLDAKQQRMSGRADRGPQVRDQDQGPAVTATCTDDFGVIRRYDQAGQGGTLVVMTAAQDRRPHGHFDALSVWFTRRNQPVLVDSGGPYAYDQQLRFDYFLTSRAHNTILVDGADYRGPARMVRCDSTAQGHVLLGEIADNGGMHHQRIVALQADDTLLVVDRLTSLDGAEHQLNLLYHLDPEAQLTLEADQGLVCIGDDVRLWVGASSQTPALRSTSGDQDADFPGWVTSRPGTCQAAPVLIAEISGDDVFLVSVVEGDEPLSGLRFTGAGEALRVELLYQNGPKRDIALASLFQQDLSAGDLAGFLWPQPG